MTTANVFDQFDTPAPAASAPAASAPAASANVFDQFDAPQTSTLQPYPESMTNPNAPGAVNPRSDFGDWVNYSLENQFTAVGNSIPDLLSGGTWRPFTPPTPTPGAQRFSQKIADLTSNIIPGQQAGEFSPTKMTGYNAWTQNPTARRVTADIQNMLPVLGGASELTAPFGAVEEGGNIVANAAAGTPRMPAEPPSQAELLSVGQTPGKVTPAPAAPAEAPAPAPAAAVPVTHAVDGNTHTFTSPNGVTTAMKRGSDMQIVDTHTDPDAQGQGQGIARAEQVHAQAQTQGGDLVSDTKVSPDAQNVYAGLERRGYPVQKNPTSYADEDGTLNSGNSQPVYRVGPKALNGLPTQANVPGLGPIPVGPSAAVRQTAQDYARSAGIDYKPPTNYIPVDPDKAATVAAAYDAMGHTPNAPATAASYKAFKQETLAQYQAMQRAGVNVEFMPSGDYAADPYAASPRLAIQDIKDNNHLYIRPSGDDVPAGHPMGEDSGVQISGQPASYNDLFRATHDYFGHAAEGNGFRGDGEYNAWRTHRPLYSPEAQGALASETLGQNAWVNYGPNGAANRTASGANTVFAEQKAGLMPKSIWGAENPAGQGS